MSNISTPNQPSKKPKLLDQVRNEIRLRHYSYRTEQTYVDWIKRYIFFHKIRHPKEMGSEEVKLFLTHLVQQRRVAAKTQNQALNALVFLYKHVLKMELRGLKDIPKAKGAFRIPPVMTKDEVKEVLSRLEGIPKLISTLLYGTRLTIKRSA